MLEARRAEVLNALEPVPTASLHGSDLAALGLQPGDVLTVESRRGQIQLQARRDALKKAGGYPFPEHQTPWQEIFRKEVDQLSHGMVMKGAVKFQRVAKVHPVPRDNH